MNLLDRLAKKLARKVEPSAVAMGGESQATTVNPAAAAEIKKEEEAERA